MYWKGETMILDWNRSSTESTFIGNLFLLIFFWAWGFTLRFHVLTRHSVASQCHLSLLVWMNVGPPLLLSLIKIIRKLTFGWIVDDSKEYNIVPFYRWTCRRDFIIISLVSLFHWLSRGFCWIDDVKVIRIGEIRFSQNLLISNYV